jgi:hypothetical protein
MPRDRRRVGVTLGSRGSPGPAVRGELDPGADGPGGAGGAGHAPRAAGRLAGEDPPAASALYDWLNRAFAEKRIRRVGSGTRLDPWRYYLRRPGDLPDLPDLPPLR